MKPIQSPNTAVSGSKLDNSYYQSNKETVIDIGWELFGMSFEHYGQDIHRYVKRLLDRMDGKKQYAKQMTFVLHFKQKHL